jgi:hypothetical protein
MQRETPFVAAQKSAPDASTATPRSLLSGSVV